MRGARVGCGRRVASSAAAAATTTAAAAAAAADAAVRAGVVDGVFGRRSSVCACACLSRLRTATITWPLNAARSYLYDNWLYESERLDVFPPIAECISSGFCVCVQAE
jgi:hypothetical protein